MPTASQALRLFRTYTSLAGSSPTIADVTLLPFLAVGQRVGVPVSEKYPHIARWLGVMTQRPSWQKFAELWATAESRPANERSALRRRAMS